MTSFELLGKSSRIYGAFPSQICKGPKRCRMCSSQCMVCGRALCMHTTRRCYARCLIDNRLFLKHIPEIIHHHGTQTQCKGACSCECWVALPASFLQL